MTNVQDKTECGLAAKSLDMRDTTAVESQASGRPYGCIYAQNAYDYLIWYSPNGAPYPSADCGAYDGSKTFPCICRLPGKHNF